MVLLYQTISKMTETQKVIKWLNEHPLFSVNGMCKMVGIKSMSNFKKYFDKGEIQDKYLPKIVQIIKRYGYE